MAQLTVNDEKYPEFRNWFAEPRRHPIDNATPSLDGKDRQLVLENALQAIQQFYLDPTTGADLTNAFRNHVYGGAYDHVTDGNSLAKAITSDLQSISGDKHFRCLFGIPGHEPSREEQVRRLQKLRYGFGEVKSLPGPENIAAVEIHGFVPVHWEGVCQRIDEVMASLAGANALLLDLRKNRGGDPKTVALVASYLLGSDPIVWLRTMKPSDGSVEEILTAPPVQEKRLSRDKPIFVITGSETISGGEDLAYGLQALNRAKVIGERTVGAANLPRACVLNDSFALSVPHRYPLHPVTGSNWEGSGVTPDVNVTAADAFKKAYNLVAEALGLSSQALENTN